MKKLSILTTLVAILGLLPFGVPSTGFLANVTIAPGSGIVVADTRLVSQPGTINIDDSTPVCALSVLKTVTPDTIVPSPAPGCSTGDKPTSLTFKYTGESCAASDHGQGDKAKCNGDPGLAEPVSIVYTGKDPDQITVSPSDQSISVGDLVTVEATGRDRLHASTRLEIRQGSNVLQSLEIHTSCSQPLKVGDVFGGLELVAFNGQQATGTEVTYEYEVTNNGSELSDVSVVDDKLGTVAGPISLGAGETRTFTQVVNIFETTTNVVTVSGLLADSQVCQASDMATVTVEPPPASCADGKPRAVVFEYTGEACAASDNDQGDKAKCSGDPGFREPVFIVYTGKDPDKITVSPSDQSIFIGDLVTVEATGRDRLHASTKLEIRQGTDLLQSLEIHTSCSQPLNVGDQFGSLILREFIPEGMPVEPVRLELEKTVDPTIAQPGDVLAYVITLQNVGTVVANDVNLTDNIPLGTTYVNNSMQVSSGFGQYIAAENRIFWQGDLVLGQTVTITFNVYVQDGVVAGSTIGNTAYAGGEQATAITLIETVEDPAWVLLVYLSADNNLDNLDYHVIRDKEAFNALERAAYLNPRLRIYVQWDRSPNYAGDTPDDHTRRYRVRPDLNPFALAAYTEGIDTWDLGEENMGDPQTLYEFITWARSRYNSTYDALSIIGHGGGWSPTLDPALGYTRYLPTGIAWDDSSGDYLSTKEIGDSLYWATDGQVNPFDVLFFDASMMAMLENAYEVRDSATYLVASEGAVWARFAYDEYLVYDKGTDETTTPLDFAEKIVAGYAASLEGYPLTMGALAIDLTSLTPLANAVDDLALALTESLTTTRPFVAQAYTMTQKFDSNWDLELAVPDAYVDLRDFAHQLDQLVPVTVTAVHTSAQAVIDAWGSVVVTETHRNGQPWLDPSVTWNFDGAHGLSIYLPLGEDLWLRGYYRGTELALVKDTQWDEFIHDGWYEGEQPPPLPSGTIQLVGVSVPTPINPDERPGLLPVQRCFLYLPMIQK